MSGMKTIEMLVAEGLATKLMIGGKEYVIKKMSAITYWRFAKFIIKVGAKLEGFKGTETDLGDMIKFADVLNEAEFLEFLSILLNEPDSKACEEIDGDELISVLDALCKHNDFGNTLKNLQRVIGQIRAQMNSKPMTNG